VTTAPPHTTSSTEMSSISTPSTTTDPFSSWNSGSLGMYLSGCMRMSLM
jgi:hypothetical protein